MKKLLYILIGLIMVVFLALMIVPKMINWNTKIAAIVKEATGRELRIDGDVQVSILPSLTFSLHDVHLANAPGMQAPQMLSVGMVSGKLRLLPLLARRVVLDAFIIQEPSVNLEIAADGRANWTFAAAGDAAAEPQAPESDGGGLPVKGLTLGDVRLSQGHFSFINATTGQKVVAKDVDLKVALAHLGSPFTLALRLNLNGEPVTVDVAMDSPQQLLEGGAASLQAAVVSKHLNTDYRGKIQQKPVPALDGIFKLDIASVGQLAAWLERPLDRPDPGPLAVRAVFKGAEKTVTLSEATITGKALKARATGNFDGSGEIAKLALTIESETLDIDRYLPPASTGKKKARPRRVKADASRDFMALFSAEPLDLRLLRQSEAKVKIAIQGIKAMGYEVGQIDFTTSLQKGQLTTALNKLQLYGGNIKGAVKLDASGAVLGVDASLDIDAVKVDKLARAASGGQTPITGIASGNIKATAQGKSPRQLLQTLQGKLALQLGGVNKAPAGAISQLKVDLDLPGIERAPSFKGSVVYNKQRVNIDLTTDPLRKVLSDDTFELQAAVNSKLITLGYKGNVQSRPVPGLDGAFALDIPSVGQLAAWVGQPLDSSQPDPGPLKMQALFKGDGAKIALSNATLVGKALKATASGSYDGSGNIARIVLKVDSDVLDIDRYLPKSSPQRSAPAAKAKTSPGTGNLLAGLSDQPFALAGLQKKTADVQIGIAGIKAMGYKIDRVALTTTLKDGVLTADFRQVNLYSGNMKGTFKLDAAGKQVGINSAFDFKGIKIDDAAATALAGKLTARGAASGHVQIGAQGASPRALVENMRAELALNLAGADIRLPNAGSVSKLEIDLDIPGLSKPSTLKGQVVYNKEALGLDLKLDSIQKVLSRKPFMANTAVSSQVLQASYAGTLQQQPNPALDGTLNLDVPSVARLATWLEQPLAKGQPDPGPVNLRAVFEAKASQTALKEAVIKGKALQAKATGRLDRRGDKPVIHAAIQVQNADLNAYLPPPAAKQAAADRKPAAAKAQPGTWSNEALDLTALSSADADLDIQIDALRYRELTIKPGQIKVKLQKGVLDVAIDPLQVSDGAITSKVHLDAAKQAASLNYQVDITNLEARPLLKTLADNDRLSGKTTFNLQGSASGSSQLALVRSLNGKGQFKFLDGAIHGINIPAMLRRAKTLGLRTESEEVKTDFAELSGSFVIKQGVLENQDLKMLAPLLRLSGRGQVPMPPRTIDYDITAKLVSSLKGQGGEDALAGLPIPIKVSGPWHNITYQVDWQNVFREMAKDPERLKNLPQELQEASKNFGVNLPIPGLGTGSGTGTETGTSPLKELEKLRQLLPGGTGSTTTPPPTQEKTSGSTTTQPTTQKSEPETVDPLKALKGLFGR